MGTAPGWRQWEDAWWVPTSAGRQTKLSKELQQGFCGLVLWLEEQEGCQALPQCRLQLCLLRLPGKCFVCIRDRDSSESPWFTAHWGAALSRSSRQPPQVPSCYSSVLFYRHLLVACPSLVASPSQVMTFVLPMYRLFP